MRNNIDESQLKLVNIEVGTRVYSLNENERCPSCHKGTMFYVDRDWKPYDGIDPRMIRVKCRTCDQFYYMVKGKK